MTLRDMQQAYMYTTMFAEVCVTWV